MFIIYKEMCFSVVGVVVAVVCMYVYKTELQDTSSSIKKAKACMYGCVRV